MCLNGNERIRVYQKAFQVLYAKIKKAMLRLSFSDVNGKLPTYMRGKHINHGNVLPPEILNQIDNPIKSLPLLSSHHYSKEIRYCGTSRHFFKKFTHVSFFKRMIQLVK